MGIGSESPAGGRTGGGAEAVVASRSRRSHAQQGLVPPSRHSDAHTDIGMRLQTPRLRDKCPPRGAPARHCPPRLVFCKAVGRRTPRALALLLEAPASALPQPGSPSSRLKSPSCAHVEARPAPEMAAPHNPVVADGRTAHSGCWRCWSSSAFSEEALVAAWESPARASMRKPNSSSLMLSAVGEMTVAVEHADTPQEDAGALTPHSTAKSPQAVLTSAGPQS